MPRKETNKKNGRPRKIDFNMNGEKTRKKLDKLGVVSPSMKRRILIGRGIWCVPTNQLMTKPQLKKWIAMKRQKLNITL